MFWGIEVEVLKCVNKAMCLGCLICERGSQTIELLYHQASLQNYVIEIVVYLDRVST